MEPVVICREEGGKYIPFNDEYAPIRIYWNGRVEDDIAFKVTGSRIRGWKTKKEMSVICASAHFRQ